MFDARRHALSVRRESGLASAAGVIPTLAIQDSVDTTRDPRQRRHHLPRNLFILQACLAAVLAPWYQIAGISIDWSSARLLPVAQLTLLAGWWYARRYANHPTKFIFADVLLATSLLLLLTNIVSPAQYLAVSLQRPLVDEWLVRADAAIGIDVGALARWTASHPKVSLLLTLCYVTLLPQFLLPMMLLGLRYRDRDGLWEYVFHFHFCLLVTVVALALFPAECAFVHQRFVSTLDQTRFVAHFTALRTGTFDHLDFTDVEGLISMPSFHAAGAFMVTWAFRKHRGPLVALGLVNTGLVAATFMSGAHYFVDVLASGVLFLTSIIAFRLLTRIPQAAGCAPAAPVGAAAI